VIGVTLPMDKIAAGIQNAVGSLGDAPSNFTAASEAITTTDKSPKVAHSAITIGGESVAVAAMAKGAGMIGPRMATMLGVVMTDAKITSAETQKILDAATAASFNRISVEGHMSTNDAVMLLASGKSPARITSDADIEKLSTAITEVCVQLAKMIPADGEGASHLIQINVQGTGNDNDADRVARTVAASALVKTAVTGNDPNWGRIVSAVGYAGVDLNANEINLKLNGFELFTAGQPVPFDAAEVSKSIGDNFETLVELHVGAGAGKATHWTSDLTVDYVRFNSEYTT
jgi:glutamate N-acetyltransferase/amino-acid N-acetyltransferase